jgi:hypothetical protein
MTKNKANKATPGKGSGTSVQALAESTQAQPTALEGNATGTTPAAVEADQSTSTVPAAEAITKKPSSTELTAPKIGAVIQGLDDIGEKFHAKLVEFAPDFDQQLKQLAKADDAQLKKQFDEYKVEDRKHGQGITAILKKRRQLFHENIGLFWTIHECIVSPGFRSDLNGGKERTADYNFKMWGASTWQEFVERHSPYGLDATDNYVKEFGDECGTLLKDGTTGVTEPVAGKQKNKGGNAGPKKKRRPTVIETANAKLAAEFKSMCNLVLNSEATPDQVVATLKSMAEKTCKDLTAVETKALKMPKILEPKQSDLEKLSIALAKRVWASTLLPADSEEKRDAHKILLKAGVAATMTPAPAKGQTDPKIGVVINDQAAEYLSIRIARGRHVDDGDLAQYEKWLALKGETERAISLRRELREWRDARDRKSSDATLDEAVSLVADNPAAAGAA